MKKMTVAVLFGGASSEYKISLLSATSVINNLSTERYNIIYVGITEEGKWYRYDGPVEGIKTGEWESHPFNRPAVISPDISHKGLLILDGSSLTHVPLDCIFPVLHGKNGEDGTVQGLFELSGIPYVGCDVISSANCMDKQVAHILLDAAGIRTAKWRVLHRVERSHFDCFVSEYEQALGYPMFIKPANAGSSVGISKAHDRDELVAAVDLALRHDCKAVIEEAIVGAEVECAVLGNDNPLASLPGQITPCNEFYDYDAKYIDSGSVLDIPAKISPLSADLVKATAVKAFQVLGCSGLARVDFFVSEDGEVTLNEINTLPGFTDISMYAKLWEAEGLPYSKLVDRLIDLAVERKGERLG